MDDAITLQYAIHMELDAGMSDDTTQLNGMVRRQLKERWWAWCDSYRAFLSYVFEYDPLMGQTYKVRALPTSVMERFIRSNFDWAKQNILHECDAYLYDDEFTPEVADDPAPPVHMVVTMKADPEFNKRYLW
jgi:hypothetical protein